MYALNDQNVFVFMLVRWHFHLFNVQTASVHNTKISRQLNLQWTTHTYVENVMLKIEIIIANYLCIFPSKWGELYLNILTENLH